MSEIFRSASSLPERFQTQLKDMVVFDALICNTDRHFGNFGPLLDSETDSPYLVRAALRPRVVTAAQDPGIQVS